MSLEQVLADVAAALKDHAAALRETVAHRESTKVVFSAVDNALNFEKGGKLQEAIKSSFALNPHEAPELKRAETIIVDEQPITGGAEEIQTIVVEHPEFQETLTPAAEVTYDEMRSAFMKVPSKCGADVAREILAKFSCTKVPQVPAEHYAEVKRLSEEALAKAGK